MKNEANKLFKEQKLEEASAKYLSAINIIRLNQGLANRKLGHEAEINCRNNLAMCKLNLKQYDQVLDQCDRVLAIDPKNVKASFRAS